MIRAMRMLSDNNPAADDDASAVPLLVTPASATAGGAALLPPAGGASVYPDSNTVIILAALLCVLVCALGLNSLVRCARHCGCRSLLAMPPPPAATAAAAMVVAAPAAAAAVGLDKRELRKIPVVEYETTKAGGAVPGTECAICLGEFVDGEKVRLLPSCHHGFHVMCIDTWLAAHSSCPICRNSLLEEDRGAGEGEATVQGPEAT